MSELEPHNQFNLMRFKSELNTLRRSDLLELCISSYRLYCMKFNILNYYHVHDKVDVTKMELTTEQSFRLSTLDIEIKSKSITMLQAFILDNIVNTMKCSNELNNILKGVVQ